MPPNQQRKFTIVKRKFNNLYSILDMREFKVQEEDAIVDADWKLIVQEEWAGPDEMLPIMIKKVKKYSQEYKCCVCGKEACAPYICATWATFKYDVKQAGKEESALFKEFKDYVAMKSSEMEISRCAIKQFQPKANSRKRKREEMNEE